MAEATVSCSVEGCVPPEGAKFVKVMCVRHYGSAWQRARKRLLTVDCDICGAGFETSRSAQKRCSPECSAESQRRWSVANRDRYRERKNAHMREYAATRKSQKAEYDREYYRRNKERRARQKRENYLANLPKARAYYLEHRDEQMARNRQRAIDKPDERRERQARRRAVMYRAGANRVRERELVKARNRANGCCVYCGAAGEHWDHRVPLARGGSHCIGNLVLACAFCNHQKHAKTVMEWRIWRRRAGLPDLKPL